DPFVDVNEPGSFYAHWLPRSTAKCAKIDASYAWIRRLKAVTLAQAQAFLILAEELHFGRTAERLTLSQARVSRLIASLEIEAGGRLFQRTSRRVQITPLGAHLRDRLQIAADLLYAGLEETRAFARGTHGLLRVGFTQTTHVDALRHLIQGFERRHSD